MIAQNLPLDEIYHADVPKYKFGVQMACMHVNAQYGMKYTQIVVCESASFNPKM